MDSQVPSRRLGGHTEAGQRRRPAWLRRVTSGGTEGNERLTVLTGFLLIILLAVLGVTIVRIGQLMWLHLFLGFLLIGPVGLKMVSTGYRFARYYTADDRYRAKGPPAPALRMLAPVIVVLTVVIFATGVLLIIIGPGSDLRSKVTLIHKVAFIVWIVLTVVHVLGHLPELLRFRRVSPELRAEINELRSGIPGLGPAADEPLGAPLPGGSGRWLSLATAMVFGLVLAVALIPQFGAWTGAHAILHHHHFH
jgi:hypothetical protein